MPRVVEDLNLSTRKVSFYPSVIPPRVVFSPLNDTNEKSSNSLSLVTRTGLPGKGLLLDFSYNDRYAQLS